MTNRIPLSAEIVKLAQLRCRTTGVDVKQELARQIAQEAIYSLDPELDLLIEEDQAYSREDKLISLLDVNDLVVNGLRLDVRLLSEDGRVSIPRHLVATSYMSGGTLAVAIGADRSAAVVGFVPHSDWELQDKHANAKDEKLVFRVSSRAFDLGAQISAIAGSTNGASKKASARSSIASSDLEEFSSNKSEMALTKQRDIVDYVLNHEESWAELPTGLSRAFVKHTLTRVSIWNQKLEKLAESVQPKFHKLSKEELKSTIARIGEKFGGQPESMSFRKEMLLTLTREELSRSLHGDAFARAYKMVEQVFSGRVVGDIINEAVKSKTAMDLALTIKKQRQKVANFIDASSDELSLAMRQLALQPVYATHSQSEEEGIESVNEALSYLDACELAEGLRDLVLSTPVA